MTWTRTDLYSLGAVLYELASGRQPFAGANAVNVLFQHLEAEIPRLSTVVAGIPPAVDELVMRAVSRASPTTGLRAPERCSRCPAPRLRSMARIDAFPRSAPAGRLGHPLHRHCRRSCARTASSKARVKFRNLDADEVQSFVREILTEHHEQELERRGATDFSVRRGRGTVPA